MRTLVILFLLASPVAAQTPGSPRGENWANYNIVNSVETGYRFSTVGGDPAQYRSVVNYGSGVRLLSGFLGMHSRDGHAAWFDELTISVQNLGNDPYQSATLRLRKNRVYRYDLLWRRNEYVNPGLVTGGGGGQHLLNTQYDIEDHNVTLLPDSGMQFFLGFTGSAQTGPALTSEQLFDVRGNIYPLFADVRRLRREYRMGNEFRVFGLRVNWMRGWEDFKEDTAATAAAGMPSFRRAEPYHGTSPYWRAALFGGSKRVNLSGRFSYTSGQRGFVLDESATGVAQTRQVVASGNAQRPAATGNLTVILTPSPKLTIASSTALYHIRSSGDATFTQFDNAAQTVQRFNFNYLGIRTVAHATDASYQLAPAVGLFAGYQYSNRQIRSVEQLTAFGTPFTTPAEQTNQLQAGTLGLRLRPARGLALSFGGELGRDDNPFTPVAERNYHALNARAQYRARNLVLTATAQTNHNVNSTSLVAFSSQSRKYSVSGAWTARSWLAFDGGYSRQHLYTIGGLAYYASFQLVETENSVYLSNIHAVNGGARLSLRSRADLYLGYNRVQDTGRTFPVTFQSPLARLSVRLHDKLRWNFSYQYYGYGEQLYATRNFRAHTGYSSVAYSF